MNAVSALLFIAVATVRNMVRRQLRRIREPRYLVATIFGLLYFGNIFFRGGTHYGAEPVPRSSRPMVFAALSGLGLLVILFTWLFGGDEQGLGFSEAEIQFLFPAPLSRRKLIHYKLSRNVLLALVSAAIVTVTVGRRIAGGSALFMLGAWLGTATLSIHLVAASLTRLSLLDHGVRGPARRAIALAVPAALAGSVIVGIWRARDAWPARWEDLTPFILQLQTTAPLSWATMLLGPAIHVALAPTFSELLAWLPAALGVLGVHYLWALSTDAAFEQASIASAERRSKRLAGARKGSFAIRASARAPFSLSPLGHPAFAIYWKNLTAAVRLFSLRLALVITLPVVIAGVSVALSGGGMSRTLAAILAVTLAVSIAFFGPQVYRIDFRLDLENIDVLKSYPLRGRDLALAELLAPLTVLALGEWLFVVAAAVLAPPDAIPGFGRVPLALTAMVALPVFTLSALIVQNAAALLFPAWIQGVTAAPRGIEVIGQRLLTLMGSLLAMSLLLLPAAVVGGIAGALLHGVIGGAALPIGALAGAAVAVVLAGLGVAGIGRAFDRFDPGRG